MPLPTREDGSPQKTIYTSHLRSYCEEHGGACWVTITRPPYVSRYTAPDGSPRMEVGLAFHEDVLPERTYRLEDEREMTFFKALPRGWLSLAVSPDSVVSVEDAQGGSLGSWLPTPHPATGPARGQPHSAPPPQAGGGRSAPPAAAPAAAGPQGGAAPPPPPPRTSGRTAGRPPPRRGRSGRT